ncbi:AAC(3) family N-acetyltransferase [Streptomyces sp. NBC_00335]|uniref:aminoglycoside N(3)-acetyltransferase n=1 Tax=unclassified Streptomyces TaxID=2593676 RepID=UPI00224DA1FA|nr:MULTISPECIES: AAC(3) family N-acetyltransferase [unclassified Streptomyces]MCX5409097.1 AAC(3) family N-acetyltransferase [Streptomyces sp. NBC_00086]
MGELVAGWRAAGVGEGMALMVHASLSALGRVDGGAATVVASLREAVGPAGTVAVPAFTWEVADPDPEHVGVPDAAVAARRAAVPLFHPGLPVTRALGAVPEALRSLPDSLRSRHPQASVAAVGARAAEVTATQSLGFALGRTSPFGRLHDLGAHILLIGVGHNRNSFLHYVESLAPRPRLRVRRFPMEVAGERVWVETPDVGNDNDTHFPVVGPDFERHAGIRPSRVGGAECRLLPVPALVDFAVPRLQELLDADSRSRARPARSESDGLAETPW